VQKTRQDQKAKQEESSPISSQWRSSSTGPTPLNFISPASFKIPTSNQTTTSPTIVIKQKTSFTKIRGSSSNQSAKSLSVSSETEQEHGMTPSRQSQVSNSLLNLFDSIKLA